jgi:hypothetical protein
MSCLVRLVADLAALHLLGYPRDSKIGFGVTRYPAMLPEPDAQLRKHDGLQPRRGARTVHVVGVRRNFRMYSHNLAIGNKWLHRHPS